MEPNHVTLTLVSKLTLVAKTAREYLDTGYNELRNKLDLQLQDPEIVQWLTSQQSHS